MSLDPVWTSRHTWRSGQKGVCVCVCARACMSMCMCVGLGDQVFSSDRLKPLKENQSCHKRKVSSIPRSPHSSSFHPFPSSPFFFLISLRSSTEPLMCMFTSPPVFLFVPLCLSGSDSALPGSGKRLHA